MTEKKKSPLELIILRNRFFYIYKRKIAIIFIMVLALAVLSTVFAFYFIGKKVPPVYVPINSKYGVLPTYPLNQIADVNESSMNAKVSELALNAAIGFYDVDYLKRDERLNKAQEMFTYSGWTRLLDDFAKSKTYNIIGLQKMIVMLNPTSSPIIKRQGTDKIPNIYSWDVEFLGRIKYIPHDGVHGVLEKNVKIYMRIVRMPTVDAPKGILVDRMVVEDLVEK